MPAVEPPEPTRLGEIVWLQPYPDNLLEGAFDAPLGPEARFERTEAISLAFVTALQALPPRQVAVRPDPRHDPLREHRAPLVRAPAIAPEPIASFRAVGGVRNGHSAVVRCDLIRG